MGIIQAVEDDTPLPAGAHQPSLTQNAQLMRDPGAVDSSCRRQIADAQLTSRERCKQAQAGWIGHEGKERGDIGGRRQGGQGGPGRKDRRWMDRRDLAIISRWIRMGQG